MAAAGAAFNAEVLNSCPPGELDRPPKILVTSDAFRVGGRETFILTHLDEMMARGGGRAALLASEITGKLPAHQFEFVRSVATAGTAMAELRRWLDVGSELKHTFDASLIWCHHYRMLPAWMLSTLYRIPLLPTFHGPVTGAGRPGTALEALGMTLSISRTPILTAVSEEITRTLRIVGNPRIDVRLLPNRVRVPAMRTPPGRKRVQMLLMTRAEKLQHIRSGVEFVGRWRRSIGPAELVVFSGFRGDEQTEAGRNRQFYTAGRVLGRRWLCQGIDRLIGAAVTRFETPTDSPELQVAKSDIVLGMGRALLEGMAAGRPSVLVGYDGIRGLVTNGNFQEYRANNFSGRGVVPQQVDSVIDETHSALGRQQSLSPDVIEQIDVSTGWKHIWPILTESSERNIPNADDRSLAERLIRVMGATKCEDDFAREAYALLSPREQEIFGKLKAF